MRSRFYTAAFSLLAAALLLTGCNGGSILALEQQASPLPSASAFPQAVKSPPAPKTTPKPGPTAGLVTLTLWVPPQMDPASASESSLQLQQRLADFMHNNPGVELRLRVKAPDGPGGLLESLSAAAAAAPGAAPALVALPRSDLETAALKGLIYPLDGLTRIMDDPDWYPYARQLSLVEDSTFGLPFGGDALLLMYRPEKVGITPTDWPAVLSLGRPVIFPAADPQSPLTLALYRSAGGAIQNAQRRPVIQAEALGEVLSLYANGARQGCFPYWLAQYTSDSQAWQAYREGRANFLVTWSSKYLVELPPDSSAIPLPAMGADEYAFSSGWMWSVSDPDAERRAISIRLAEFLVGSDFLAQWPAGLGYLPVRPSSLSAWSDQSQRALVEQMALAGQVTPPNDLAASLGPVLQEATMQIIKNQIDPSQAAEAAAARLSAQ